MYFEFDLSTFYMKDLGEGSSGPRTRQAADRGIRHQSRSSPSSVTGQKGEIVSQHPLVIPVDDDNVKVTTEITLIFRELRNYG